MKEFDLWETLMQLVANEITLKDAHEKIIANVRTKINFGTQDDIDIIKIKRIREIVANFYQIEPDKIVAHDRHRTIMLARHVAVYLTRQNTNLSLKEIGYFFGGRDHSTIIHSLGRIEDSLYLQDDDSKSIKRVINLVTEYFKPE